MRSIPGMVATLFAAAGAACSQTPPTDPPAADAPRAVAEAARVFVGAPKPLHPEAVTEDWPGFLGPRRDGVCRESRLDLDWSDGPPPLVWSVERGEGYAAPAIQGDRLVHTHREGSVVHVDCRDAASGELRWRFSRDCDFRSMYSSNGGPRATPTIDGDRVYVLGIDAELHALSMQDGAVLWHHPLPEEHDLTEGFFGAATSPLAVEDRVIVNVGANGGPTVVAYDRRDGAVVWSTGSDWGMACSSPVLGTVAGEQRLFVIAAGRSRPPSGGLMVIDPEDGTIDWTYPFRSRTYQSVVGASPVVTDAGVLLTAAYNTGTALVAPDASGAWQERWKIDRFGVDFATPIVADGLGHLIQGTPGRYGGMVRIDLATGEQLERFDPAWDDTVTYAGSEREMSFTVGTGCAIRVAGELLVLGDQGHLLRVRADRDGVEVRDRWWPFRAAESWTPPVISRGLLYLCQNTRERYGDQPRRLLCYDLRAG